jgi:radical SAM superfamily enzyme YgiQ (UPF0313 family)
MRVLFISANRTETNMRTIPLGLGCVAAAAQGAGHAVRVLDLIDAGDLSRALADAIHGFSPEAIGISLRNIDDQNMRSPQIFFTEAVEIIAEVRRHSSAPIILGGAGYSMYPEALLHLSAADMGISGEGEEAITQLLAKLERGEAHTRIPGLCVSGKDFTKRVFAGDLDEFLLPGPDVLSLPAGGKPILPVQTRRGCPMKCFYCSTASIEGTRIRKRSPRKVVEWIARWAAKGVRQFYFVDNTFNLPPSYAMDLCRELTGASPGVKWRCIVYPLRVNERLAAAMAEAGCSEAAVGFESGSERMLKAMNKRFSPADVRETCTVLKARGIRRMGFLLLGGPGETLESVEESLAFADTLKLEALKISIGVRVYPNTQLAEQARKEGVIGNDDDLLYPRFYLAPGLEGWIRDTVATYAATRPYCITDA